MAKTRWISLRASPELQEAIKRAAADDDRSVASYVERVLRAHLAERGYLADDAAVGAPEPAPKRPRRRRP